MVLQIGGREDFMKMLCCLFEEQNEEAPTFLLREFSELIVNAL